MFNQCSQAVDALSKIHGLAMLASLTMRITTMMLKQFNPPHLGGLIKRVYIEPYDGILANSIALTLDVSPSTFNRLINVKSDISPEMAIRLSKALGRTPESWMLM